MKIIPQKLVNNDPNEAVSEFLKEIGLGKITHLINFKRASRVTLTQAIVWLMQARFARLSMEKAKPNPAFSTRAVRNLLNDGRINWQRLVALTACAIINLLRPFIDCRRKFALVLDDTLVQREYSKKTELLANVYDHNEKRYVHGYRGLTVGWTDGNTFLPVNFALMSSKNKRNIVGTAAQTTDLRTQAGKRRVQAQSQMNDVAVQLIKQPLAQGVPADYVLMDTWYSSPKMFHAMADLGLDSVAMMKRSKKLYVTYRHRQLSIKALYRRFHQRGRKVHDNYLYSCVVMAHDGEKEFPLKLVFVAKRNNVNDYLVLATTKLTLTPETIVQLYERRWSIETYFRAAKQYLRLDKTQSQSYDGQCGYMAITVLTYQLLAWQERLSTDDRTIGDLFYIMNEALPEIQFIEALVYLIAELEKVKEKLVSESLDKFITSLPVTLQNVLTRAA